MTAKSGRRRRSATTSLVLVVMLLGIAALGTSKLDWRSLLPSSLSNDAGGSGPNEPPKSAAAMQTFSGTQFSMLYPSGWRVERAETSPAGVTYLDTTIRRSDGDPHFLIRVDVDGDAPPPAATADSVVAALRDEAGFRRLRHQSTTVSFQNGSSAPAVYLEFLLAHPDTGVAMHNIDIFFRASGRTYAVLTRAPEDEWGAWRNAFELVRDSISVS